MEGSAHVEAVAMDLLHEAADGRADAALSFACSAGLVVNIGGAGRKRRRTLKEKNCCTILSSPRYGGSSKLKNEY